MILASGNGYLEVVKALLDAKAHANAKASNGTTALMIATQQGRPAVVQAVKKALLPTGQ